MFLQAALTALGVLLILMMRATAAGFIFVGGLMTAALVLALLGVRMASGAQLAA
jgi:hypothetical protein